MESETLLKKAYKGPFFYWKYKITEAIRSFQFSRVLTESWKKNYSLQWSSNFLNLTDSSQAGPFSIILKDGKSI